MPKYNNKSKAKQINRRFYPDIFRARGGVSEFFHYALKDAMKKMGFQKKIAPVIPISVPAIRHGNAKQYNETSDGEETASIRLEKHLINSLIF